MGIVGSECDRKSHPASVHRLAYLKPRKISHFNKTSPSRITQPQPIARPGYFEAHTAKTLSEMNRGEGGTEEHGIKFYNSYIGYK